jgi:hypothetical protein
MILGFALAACGGTDFEAASPGDGGGPSNDANLPSQDAAFAEADVASRSDDGVPDANGERVVEDATAIESGDVTSDAPADVVADVLRDATCDALTTFYRDRDRDGFGSTSDHVTACTMPLADDGGAWVLQPGDCRDDLPDVKPFAAGSPDPPRYSGTGYADPVKPRGISFDYDCNGDETADPTNQFGAAPTCPALSTNCAGTGYLPATPGRSGIGVNPLCGSTTLRSCVVQGLNCKEQLIEMSTPFRCR